MVDLHNASKNNPAHHGRNLKLFREMLGLTQKSLMVKLEGDWIRRKVAMLEGETNVNDQIEELAKALKIPIEAILNIDEQKAIYNIQNNYGNTSNPSQHCQSGFNPLDKFVEAIEKNDNLVAENRKLYEALLQAERDKNRLERDKNVLIIRLLTVQST